MDVLSCTVIISKIPFNNSVILVHMLQIFCCNCCQKQWFFPPIVQVQLSVPDAISARGLLEGSGAKGRVEAHVRSASVLFRIPADRLLVTSF